MKNYKGEQYPRNLNAIYKDFEVAAKIIEKFFKANPIKIKEIAKEENGQIILNKDLMIKKFKLENYIKSSENYGRDLKGIYVFADIDNAGKIEYKYVGISRSLFKRVKDHGFGKTKYMATLANLMAKHYYNEEYGSKEGFELKNHLHKSQSEIKNWYIALYPIDCNFELHMIEPHLSYHWKSYWNTFETH
jgi:hypothetical protein